MGNPEQEEAKAQQVAAPCWMSEFPVVSKPQLYLVYDPHQPHSPTMKLVVIGKLRDEDHVEEKVLGYADILREGNERLYYGPLPWPGNRFGIKQFRRR